MSGPAILLDEVSKYFESLKALDAVSLEVPEASLFAVVGPRGAGKTTLIRILTTILRPDEGVATVGGYDVVDEAARVREIVGLSSESPALDHHISGWENLFVLGRLVGLGRRGARDRADELIEGFGLVEEGPRVAGTYSRAVRRRLDLAAALVGTPALLFVDEPTRDLDPQARSQVWDILAGLVEEGTTVLLATGDLEEANRLADGMIILDHGRVIGAATPDELGSRFGRQIIEVGPKYPEDLEDVRKILQPFAVNGATVNVDGGLAAVPIPEAAAFWGAAKKLETRRVEVDRLSLRELNLDDVFLMLTGHAAEESVAEPEPVEGE